MTRVRKNSESLFLLEHGADPHRESFSFSLIEITGFPPVLEFGDVPVDRNQLQKAIQWLEHADSVMAGTQGR